MLRTCSNCVICLRCSAMAVWRRCSDGRQSQDVSLGQHQIGIPLTMCLCLIASSKQPLFGSHVKVWSTCSQQNGLLLEWGRGRGGSLLGPSHFPPPSLWPLTLSERRGKLTSHAVVAGFKCSLVCIEQLPVGVEHEGMHWGAVMHGCGPQCLCILHWLNDVQLSNLNFVRRTLITQRLRQQGRICDKGCFTL